MMTNKPKTTPDSLAAKSPWTSTQTGTGAQQETPRCVAVAARLPISGRDFRRIRIGEIGSGGSAVVSRVLDANLLRVTALKELGEICKTSQSTVGRFIEEAQILAQLDHPNIIPVHEIDCDEAGNPYFTMKLVEGQNLKQLIDANDCQTRTSAELFSILQIFLKVQDAVSFAHARGVVHRDLKPENIMVGQYGEVYVMDWGLAKLMSPRDPASLHGGLMPSDLLASPLFPSRIEEGQVYGTPGYMAPEQAVGDIASIDEQSDVFALGAILYAILVGEPPYVGKNSREVFILNLTFEAQEPSARVDFEIPERLCSIAMKALARDKARRYKTVAEMKEDIEEFLQSGWQLKVRNFVRGDVILREGEVGSEAYVVTEGRCEVIKNLAGTQLRIAELGPGEVFGETAMLTELGRTATVRALEDVEVFVITKEQLEQQMGMGLFVSRIIKALANRFHDQGGQFSSLAAELSDAKLELSLHKLIFAQGERVGRGRIEAKWSRVAPLLASQFGLPEQDLAAAAARLPVVELDLGADIVSCTLI